jgi:hypothetical protein
MKQLQDALLREVGERIAELGFERKPIGQSFVRRFKGGRAAFHLAFIKHPADFDVVADVASRFDALEDLVDDGAMLQTMKNGRKTYSLGAELGNISGVGQMRWRVARQEDVSQVAEQLVGALKSIGIPYLARASTYDGAYQMLTAPGRGAWLHKPIHAARAKRIIGLVKLLGQSQAMTRCIEENIRMLEDLNDPGLEDFRRFATAIADKQHKT